MGESRSRRQHPKFFYLAGGLAMIAVSVYGFLLLRMRPGVPAEIDRARLVRVDDIEVVSGDDKLALAGKTIGTTADFYVRAADGSVRKITAAVVPYYSQAAIPWIFFLIGLFSFVLAGLTYVLRPDDRKAKLFYWMGMTFGAAVTISGEGYGLWPDRWPTFLPSFLFIVSYALVPAFLLRFSLAFSSFAGRLVRSVVFLPGLVLAGIQEVSFFYSFLKPSPGVYRVYIGSYPVFRAYLIVFALAAIVHLGFVHRKSEDEESRSQIKWIFTGLTVGLLPFLLLYQVPRVLGLLPPLTEEVSTIFFAAIPAAMAIAIIRYRLMDVVLVINRSLVYSLLTVFIVGVYLLVVEGTRALLTRIVPVGQGFLSVLGVFAAAAVFQPAQKRIQNFVDRAFFRQRYDYRRTVLEFNQQAIRLPDRDGLLGYFLQVVRWTIPVESLSLAVDIRRPAGTDRDLAVRLGDPLDIDPAVAFGKTAGPAVWARRQAVEAPDLVDLSLDPTLDRHRIDVVLALPLSPAFGLGWLILGKKKSGGRYGRDDLDLLRTLLAELSVSLERLFLQEEVIYERASKEKLDELNRLKTEFISTVSHELRTPMSSIQGLAEVLQAGKLKSREAREKYINLMVAESGRLSRFLHNVLDFGRIERQAKSYHFMTADLRSVIEEAVDIFRPALDDQGFRVTLRLPDRPVERRLDADAVKQALINVIDNAMKYSAANKTLEVELREGNPVEIRVKDEGIGIAPEDAARIFDKFYRAEAAGRLCPQGAGLGLKIVKHIMDAHGGEVRVESEPGRGSTFRLIFGEP